MQIGKYFKKRNVARDTFKRSRRSCSRKSLKERIACSERSILQEMGLLTATTRERTFTPRMRKKSHTAADWFAFEAKASNESANVTNAAFSGIRCSFYGSSRVVRRSQCLKSDCQIGHVRERTLKLVKIISTDNNRAFKLAHQPHRGSKDPIEFE